jgi:integrase
MAAPHLKRFLKLAYEVGPGRGDLLKLEWLDVEMARRKFILPHTKKGQTRIVLMTPIAYEVFLQLWTERRLDSHPVFLYKGKPWENLRTGLPLLVAEPGSNADEQEGDPAIKVVGHKSEQMHRRYSTIEPAHVHEAVAKLHRYAVNKLITPLVSEPAQLSSSAGNHSVGA